MGLYLGKEKVSNVASVVTQNADSMATEIQNHIANSNIHITAAERTKWNAAAENSSSPTEDFASTGVMGTNLNINNNAITNVNKINFTDYLNTSDGSTTFYTKLTKTQTINDVLNQAGIGTQYNGDYVLSFYGNDAYPPVLIQYIRANGGSSPTVMLNNIADPATDYDAANKHYVDSKALPTASTADNGKVLSVVNGAWAAAAMSSGAYLGSYTGTDADITLSFNFKPAAIFIVKYIDSLSYSCSYIAINGFNKLLSIRSDYTSVSGANTSIIWGNKSITITHDRSAGVEKPTANGDTFYYIAIPAMN